MQVPLIEHNSFFVIKELELDVGAGDILQEVPALLMVRDRPDQNPVPGNLQEENRLESDRTVGGKLI